MLTFFNDHLHAKIRFETAYWVASTHFDFDKGTLNSFFLHQIKSVDPLGNIIWNDSIYGTWKHLQDRR
jgi:hypothetical protein